MYSFNMARLVNDNVYNELPSSYGVFSSVFIS